MNASSKNKFIIRHYKTLIVYLSVINQKEKNEL